MARPPLCSVPRPDSLYSGAIERLGAGEFDLSIWKDRRGGPGRGERGQQGEVLPPAPQEMDRSANDPGSFNEPDYDLRSGYYTRVPPPR